jgi:DNA-binding FadR family transcriptional regulator
VLLSDRIHASLRADILSGDLPPGAAVPSERRLSEQLGGATRVRDWRRDGGLDLLLALAASGEVPPELEAERAALELRACVGADAARRCAERADAPLRAAIVARAEALAADAEPEARNVEYERLWDAIVDGSGNVAYRLALNTLVAGQHVLVLDARRVAAELGDGDAIRALAGAIAEGDAAGARAIAAELLERSVA